MVAPMSPDAVRGPLDDLLIFHELARALTSNLDLASVLRTVRAYMDRFIKADFWALLMLDGDGRELYYTDPAGNRDPNFVDIHIRMGEGLAGWVAEHGETLIIPEIQPKDEFKAQPDPRLATAPDSRPLTVHSAIGLPLRGARGTHGVVEIFNPHLGETSDYNIAFLHILVDFAAIAIENAQDVARTQQLTITDDATGLFNTRHLYAVLERELETARRDSKPLSLVFLDLDRFKLVNDAHGHLIGTELLVQVGRLIRTQSRSTDVCFRYGGDEFVILMPSTTREEALRMARSIHSHIAQQVFTVGRKLQLTISSSAGIATYPGDGRTIHAILGAADQRMYHVKSTGRGRVEA